MPSLSKSVWPSVLSGMPSLSESSSRKLGRVSLSVSISFSVWSGIPSPSESKSRKLGTPSQSMSPLFARLFDSMKLEIPSPSQSPLFQARLGVNTRLAILKLHPSFGSVPSAISLSSGTPSPSVSEVKTVNSMVFEQALSWV